MSLKKIIKKILPNKVTQNLRLIKLRIQNNAYIKKTRKHYKSVENEIRQRGGKLRIAAYVPYDASFGGDSLFTLIISKTELYDAKFVIIPDIVRGRNHSIEQYEKTKNYFVSKFGQEYVLDGWNSETNEFFDLSDQFDVIYLSNPYDSMVNGYHSVKYLATKKVLPIYINYGYSISKWHYSSVEQNNIEMSLFYKYFTDTTYTQKQVKKYQIGSGKNTVLSGYAKLDKLLVGTPKTGDKKLKILLSPHHTIKELNFELQLSNFVTYSDLILELPDLFPEVEFIFRPHPMLFVTLVNKGVWTEKQVSEYIDNLKKKSIEYSTGGDYLHIFNECDAIIHDCGSYMVEWLFTGKPCCYVVKEEQYVRKQLDLLGNKALDYHILAASREDIISFINQVIKKEIPYGISDEIKSNIMINYPNVSDFILKNIYDDIYYK